jgi:hypothetical protein
MSVNITTPAETQSWLLVKLLHESLDEVHPVEDGGTIANSSHITLRHCNGQCCCKMNFLQDFRADRAFTISSPLVLYSHADTDFIGKIENHLKKDTFASGETSVT